MRDYRFRCYRIAEYGEDVSEELTLWRSVCQWVLEIKAEVGACVDGMIAVNLYLAEDEINVCHLF